MEKLRAEGDVPGLVKALRHKHGTLRAAAARALGELQDSRALVPLLGVLASPNADDVYAAAKALRDLGDPAAVPPLIECLNSNVSAFTRLEAARALGKLGDPGAVEALVNVLPRESPGDPVGVADAAVEALRVLSDPSELGPLVRVLGHDHAWVRERAARALGGLRDPRAIGRSPCSRRGRRRGHGRTSRRGTRTGRWRARVGGRGRWPPPRRVRRRSG